MSQDATNPLQDRVEIKICGLTRLEDALAADEAGADFVGFVFYSGSPRSVAANHVRGLLKERRFTAKPVGVFVNERPDTVIETVVSLGLYAAQLHGDENPADYRGRGVRIWRSVRFSASRPEPDPDKWEAERFVADAAAPGAYGGSGVKTDWQAAAELARRVPVMLAGGLTPGNVAEAIRTVWPRGVDVASGVETRPGVKSRELMRDFTRAARKVEK